MKQTYTAKITQAEDSNATGLPVPPEVVSGFGKGKKPKVKVTLRGYTYRSTVAAYGDVYMLPLSKDNRDAAGVKAGDEVEVTLELDEEPRLVTVPADLAAVLAENPGALATFETLSYTSRKEFVRQIEEAKTQETRIRRIEKILRKLIDL